MSGEDSTQDMKASEELESKNAESLAKKFRLIPGEDIHMTKKPSTFAFVGMYALALLVLFVHLLFARVDNMQSENLLLDILLSFMGFSELFSFTIVMLMITWFNRLLNTSTSGRWISLFLLLVSFSPLIIQIDKVAERATFFLDEPIGGNFNFEYSYSMFGIIYSIIFALMTFYYQNSFHYAITSDAVIFEHSFLLSRSHRRILFDRISEVIVERTPIGTVFGYATVSILTDSGVGIVDESMGAAGAVSMPGSADSNDDTVADQAKKSLLRSFVGILTYQRTIRTVRPDPKHCFYSIRDWDKCKMLLNEMHKKHSQSNLLSDLKDSISAANDE